MFPKKFPVLFTDSSGNNYQPEIFSCEYKICWEVPLWSQKQFTHLTTIELLVPLDITLNMDSIYNEKPEYSYTGSSEISVNKIVIANNTDHKIKSSNYNVDVYHDGGLASANIYTDTAIPEAISQYLALPLDWSEYLQQEDGIFNLEIDFHNQTYKNYIPETAYPL